jgi:hypothetical protein
LRRLNRFSDGVGDDDLDEGERRPPVIAPVAG